MLRVAVVVVAVLMIGAAGLLAQRVFFDGDDADTVSTSSADHGSRLGPGDDELGTGERLVAGSYELTVDKSGAINQTHGGKVVWSTMTDDAVRLVMQPDCNLVAYTKRNAVAWESNTAGAGSSCTVRMQKGDGNVVVIAPGNKPVWSSR
jgi:hypothetical protein